LAEALERLAPLGPRVAPGGSLGPLTTYRVGGTAAVLVTAASAEDLGVVADAVAGSGLPVLVVGRGSNLLVADRGFGGIAVVLDPDGFGEVSVTAQTLRAGGAVALPALARQSVEAGLSGLEWAVGVPGSVGGAVRMNAGGHGSDMAHTLSACEVIDLASPALPASPAGTATPPGHLEHWALADLGYRYRHSAIRASQVVTWAEFELAPGDREAGRQTIREIVRWRRDHQPGGQNAGSVFTNPEGDSAGRLIDEAGLKGRRWRTAMVSPKHANFIQAEPAGSADDVRDLMTAIQAEVKRIHGVDLRPEVRLIGFPPESQPQVEGLAGSTEPGEGTDG
jgi:UDP-N-acetylmuramate dehydrogenase